MNDSEFGTVKLHLRELMEKYAKFGAENFAQASRQAVVDMIEDIGSALENR